MRRRWSSGDVTGLLAAPFYVPVPFERTRYLPGDVEPEVADRAEDWWSGDALHVATGDDRGGPAASAGRRRQRRAAHRRRRVDVPRARRRRESARRALRGAARPRAAAAHRRPPRQRARLLLLALRRGAVPLGHRRHQLDVPRRATRDARPTQRLSTRRDRWWLRSTARRCRHRRAPRPGARVDTAEYAKDLARGPASLPDAAAHDDDLFLLIFTSGSTGLPKAVRCTQGRYARTGTHVATVTELGPGDVVYAPLPFFHSSSLFTGWASAINAGIPITTRRSSRHRTRCPTSGASARRCSRTPARCSTTSWPHPSNPTTVTTRFGSPSATRRRVATSASSPAASTATSATATGPPKASSSSAGTRRCPRARSGTATPTVKVVDPETGAECPPVPFGADGRPTNLDEAVGEIVETAPTDGFEGYYQQRGSHPARFHGGWYWSGDLAYRDADGWLYFAGRSNEWLRVDGENFAVAPVEAHRRSASRRSFPGRLRGARRPRGRPGDGRPRAARAAPSSTPRPSMASSPISRISGRSGSRRSCGSPPSSPSWRA